MHSFVALNKHENTVSGVTRSIPRQLWYWIALRKRFQNKDKYGNPCDNRQSQEDATVYLYSNKSSTLPLTAHHTRQARHQWSWYNTPGAWKAQARKKLLSNYTSLASSSGRISYSLLCLRAWIMHPHSTYLMQQHATASSIKDKLALQPYWQKIHIAWPPLTRGAVVKQLVDLYSQEIEAQWRTRPENTSSEKLVSLEQCWSHTIDEKGSYFNTDCSHASSDDLSLFEELSMNYRRTVAFTPSHCPSTEWTA